MSDSYTYNPDAWHPALAGVVAGAVAAIVAGVLAALLRSPDEIVANSLTVTLASLALGLVAGLLWRRIRVGDRARMVFGWTMAGGWFVAMLAVTIVDQTTLDNLVPYAAPIAAVIFITLGFLTPLFAGVTNSPWLALIPIGLALAVGIGLFGRGNVASGELTLDDVETAPTTTSAAASETTAASDSTTTTEATTTSSLSGTVAIPDDLADSYAIASGLATYSVEETLQGLETQGVGVTEEIAGTVAPAGPFSFVIDLQSFESDSGRRDSRVAEWFEEFPEGTFAGASFPLPDSAEIGDVLAFDVTGDMTINDITLPATWAVEARLEESGQLSITGETFIVLSEFDIPVISGGFVEMEDGATIEVAFSATP